MTEALRAVVKDGALPHVKELFEKREQVLTNLATISNHPSDTRDADGVLARVFASFTHREIAAMADPQTLSPQRNDRQWVCRGQTLGGNPPSRPCPLTLS